LFLAFHDGTSREAHRYWFSAFTLSGLILLISADGDGVTVHLYHSAGEDFPAKGSYLYPCPTFHWLASTISVLMP
jgi:hypothetical protein